MEDMELPSRVRRGSNDITNVVKFLLIVGIWGVLGTIL